MHHGHQPLLALRTLHAGEGGGAFQVRDCGRVLGGARSWGSVIAAHSVDGSAGRTDPFRNGPLRS